MAAAADASKAVNDVRGLLYRKLRVTLVSDRELLGDFACLDKQGNLIIANTYETVHMPSGNTEDRLMGLVLVPIAQQKKVELQATLDEEMSMLKLVEAATKAAA